MQIVENGSYTLLTSTRSIGGVLVLKGTFGGATVDVTIDGVAVPDGSFTGATVTQVYSGKGAEIGVTVTGGTGLDLSAIVRSFGD